MADFCKQCTEKHLGMPGEKNDFIGLSTPENTADGKYPVVLCEGCGAIQVDHTGTCVSSDCLEKHNQHTCRNCEYSRPNGVCENTLCTHTEVCKNFQLSTRSKTCKCGYWSCGTRGCGDCPDCYGEHCECGIN